MSNVISIMSDKSHAIQNAFNEFNIHQITCYYHVMANMKKHCPIDKWDSILAGMRILNLCKCEIDFDLLSQLIVIQWRLLGMGDVADYFIKSYLCPIWKNWYIGCLPRPGNYYYFIITIIILLV
mgnify:FL=1